eukprot:7787804-Pyramimonas_sp.AAC.1
MEQSAHRTRRTLQEPTAQHFAKMCEGVALPPPRNETSVHRHDQRGPPPAPRLARTGARTDARTDARIP